MEAPATGFTIGFPELLGPGKGLVGRAATAAALGPTPPD